MTLCVSPHHTGRLAIIQVIDSLAAGGAEVTALNFANELGERGFDSFLCSTREGGVLEARISRSVTPVKLQRTQRYDVKAIQSLRAFIRDMNIDIVHAHSSSLFISAAALAMRTEKLIWHDHYGAHEMAERSSRLYRMLRSQISGVVTVTQKLRLWSIDRIGLPPSKVWTLPNFSTLEAGTTDVNTLPGRPGRRIVCTANLRPQKDHLGLMHAMKAVVNHIPDVHLLCVGGDVVPSYTASVRETIESLGLEANVTLLGAQERLRPILAACEIGVLNSISEGFPLALIEYGMVGLPAIATDVGECRYVLAGGSAGIIVPPATPDAMASSLLSLLDASDERTRLGEALRKRVDSTFSSEAVINQLIHIYEQINSSAR